jgi:hypothetical protein
VRSERERADSAPPIGRVLVNVTYPAAEKELAQVQTAAESVGFQTVVLSIRRTEDIASAFDKIGDRADCALGLKIDLPAAFYRSIDAICGRGCNAVISTSSVYLHYVLK